MLQEAVGTIVDCKTDHAHVVSVEYTMAETITLPESNHFCRSINQLFIHCLDLHTTVCLVGFMDLLIEVFNQVIQHWLHHLIFQSNAWSFSLCQSIFSKKYFERAKAKECRCNAHYNCTFFTLSVAIIEFVTDNFGTI